MTYNFFLGFDFDQDGEIDPIEGVALGATAFSFGVGAGLSYSEESDALKKEDSESITHIEPDYVGGLWYEDKNEYHDDDDYYDDWR